MRLLWTNPADGDFAGTKILRSATPMLSTGLNGLWHSNEGSGLTAGDSSCNGNNAALQQPWTKNAANPVINLGGVGAWDSINAVYNTVINDAGTYKMWYGGDDGTNWRIGYATSADGIAWTKYASNPVLGLGALAPDDNGVLPGTVINDAGTYKMWYSCDDSVAWRICYATSADGVRGRDAGNPVLNVGASGTWDDFEVFSSSVIKEGSTYKMWYHGRRDKCAGRLCHIPGWRYMDKVCRQPRG